MKQDRRTYQPVRTYPAPVVSRPIETDFGNIDHTPVGPAGVFVLETKKLNGVLAVKRGRLAVRLHEDPEDGSENGPVARRTRGAAHQVYQALCDRDIDMWVQPLAVL